MKVNVTFLAVIKKRNNLRLIYLGCKLQQDSWFMHFQIKEPENDNKTTLRDKKTTNNVEFIFFNDRLVTER